MVLEIISSEQILFQGEVESVTLPGAQGSSKVRLPFLKIMHRWSRRSMPVPLNM